MLTLKKNFEIEIEQIINLYRNSGIRRPTEDPERMQLMINNSNLVVSCWENDSLVGLARCFVDYAWVCYMSDLLVDSRFQKSGIGAALINYVRNDIGENCQLVLLSAPESMEYYPKVGFEKANHAFIIRRKNN